jgi:NADH-quinone oxidoreductase subunit E
MKELEAIFARHEGRPSDLIPLLQDVQDTFGYVAPEAMAAIARFLKIPESKLYGVLTFYTQFYRTRQGRHRVRVCRGTACHVRGSRRIAETVARQLGIEPGQTTGDYRCSLESVACFGSCALAPVLVVDGRVHGRMTPQKAVQIVEGLT